MKRRSFVLTGAGALLAGCAAPNAPAGVLSIPEAQPKGLPAFGNADAQLLGSVLLIPYDFVPVYFDRCNGQLLLINNHLTLFSLLGTRFGGDGTKNFGLPDLRGLEPIEGLTYVIATRGIYPPRKTVELGYREIKPLLGQISCVAYLPRYVPPPDWAACDGQLRSIEKHLALYTLLGTKFGGDGSTTFALPDLRNNELGKGLTYVISMDGKYPDKGH